MSRILPPSRREQYLMIARICDDDERQWRNSTRMRISNYVNSQGCFIIGFSGSSCSCQRLTISKIQPKKKRRTKPKMEDEESGEKRRLENRAVSGSLRLCKDRTQFKIVACHFHWRLKDEVDGWKIWKRIEDFFWWIASQIPHSFLCLLFFRTKEVEIERMKYAFTHTTTC